jgi:hypothetical protein
MCAAVAITSAFLTADYLTRPQSIGASDYRSQDLPNFQDVTKNNGYYNITLAFNKVIDSEKLNNIVINPQSGKMVNDSIFYLNGTAVSQQDPVSCNLKSGDSLQINLLLPCNEFPSGSTVNLEVIGNSFGCGKAVALP